MLKKFRGHNRLHSKYIPQIPVSPEREYYRLSNQYIKLLKDTMEEGLPQIKKAYMKEMEEQRADGFRMDSKSALFNAIDKAFSEMRESIIRKIGLFNLRQKLELLASHMQRMTAQEWKKTVMQTLGINIYDDYYMGEFYRDGLDRWIEENVNLIKTIPYDSLGEMEVIVRKAYENGMTTTALMKMIQKQYKNSKSRARLIARDQISKLNGQIQRAQQVDAGIEEFTWCTCGDERVRESHRQLAGMIFRWDNPPLEGIPGQAIQCRCIGRPVFNRNVQLPVVTDEGNLVAMTTPNGEKVIGKTSNIINPTVNKPKYMWKSDNENTKTLQKQYEKLSQQYPEVKVTAVGEELTVKQKQWDDNFKMHLENLLKEEPQLSLAKAKKKVTDMMVERPSKMSLNNGTYNSSTKSIMLNMDIEDIYTWQEEVEERNRHYQKNLERQAKGRRERDRITTSYGAIGTLNHEFGHAIDDTYKLYQNPKIINLFRKYGEQEISKNVSSYATEDIYEFIAECFADSFYEDQGSISKEFMEIMKEVIG